MLMVMTNESLLQLSSSLEEEPQQPIRPVKTEIISVFTGRIG
jgi:hypothetical protein